MNKIGTFIITVLIVASFSIAPAAYMLNDKADSMDGNVILGDYSITQEKADEISKRVVTASSIENFESIKADSIVLIDSSLIDSSNTLEYRQALANCVLEGTPVVSLDDPSVFMEDGFDIPTAFALGAAACGIYYDEVNDVTTCYSIKTNNMTEAENRLYAWADDMLVQSTELKEGVALSATNGAEPEWGSEIRSHTDIDCGSYGWAYVRTNYFEQITNSDTYRYYKAGYIFQGVPNSDSRIADINIRSDVDNLRNTQQLLIYGPTSTSGTSQVSVNLNWSVSQSGLEVGMSTTWTYSVPDLAVHDYSSFGDDLFSTSHDTNEGENIGNTTTMIQPGLISSSSKSSNNGGYIVDDYYSINYCKYKAGFWPWSPWYCQDYQLYDATLRVNIP